MKQTLRRFPLLLALTALVLALSACDVVTYGAWADAKGGFDRQLATKGGVQLTVVSGSGDIRVHPGAANTVSVHAVVHARGQDATEIIRQIEQNPPIEQSGNAIQIGQLRDRSLQHNVSISYDVATPSDTRVEAHTGSGRIDVDGVKGPLQMTTGSGDVRVVDVDGDVNAATGSGGIRVENSGGSVNLHTGSGSIHGQRLGGSAGKEGASIAAETGSGSINLDSIRGALHARTGSGSIRVDGEPTGNWEAHTGSGEVTVLLPPRISFELRAETGSGGIDVDYPMSRQQYSNGKRRLEGAVGSGGPQLEVHTGSGGVRIAPGNAASL